MRNPLRDRNRWFSAVAITCLTGFALSGCTRGSHSLSKNLSDSAGREAIEAERHVAERKQKEGSEAKSKEAVAVSKRQETPSRDRASANLADDTDELPVKPVAKSATTKNRPGQTQLDDSELETADWAGDYLDRRVKTVSDDQEGVVDTAEPLLTPARKPAAKELFEDEEAVAVVKVRKPATTTKKPVSTAASEKSSVAPGRASFDGQSTHPWADKAPVAGRSTVAKPPAKSAASLGDEYAEDEDQTPARETASNKPNRDVKDDLYQEDARQSEAKARIHTLLIQSKSLLNKGEFRSAYRVAQLAQRIADSEDLFFVAGEEQPADLVRAVLMKIRAEESATPKSNALASRTLASETPAAVKPVSRTKEPVAPQRPKRSNLPDGWASDEWKTDGVSDETSSAAAVTEATADDNPWAKASETAPTRLQMKIKPGPTSRGAVFNDEFPHSKPEWKGAANEPLNFGRSAETGPKVTAHAPPESDVVQVNLDSTLPPDFRAEKTPSAAGHELIPRPFPAHSPAAPPVLEKRNGMSAEPLAVAPDWRTQDLNDVATNRGPLLVAPLPPAEPLIPDSLGVDIEDSFATDIQEPTPTQPESKLWMILAAAAGAFAMLFVRRRPAVVVRSAPESKS